MIAVLPRRCAAGAAIVVCAVLAGCGTPNKINLSSPTTISSTADGGQAAAILAAYRGSLTDFNKVSTTAPLNPNDPQLADHTSGAALAKVTSSLMRLAAAGELQRGSLVSLHAVVSQYNGSQAVVVSCEKDTVAIVNQKSGKVVPGGAASNETELSNDLVTLAGGTWKVTSASAVSPGCK